MWLAPKADSLLTASLGHSPSRLSPHRRHLVALDRYPIADINRIMVPPLSEGYPKPQLTDGPVKL